MSDHRYERAHGFQLASFKAAGDGEPTGEFEAIVSVFGNVDLGGDRIAPGAFGKSLAKWQETGDPIPVIWNHMWDNPDAHIGAIDPADAVETDGGLLVKGRIDLDNPFAAQVYRLLSQRRVKEFSFGYNVRDEKRGEGGVTELLELDVIEVGPTLKGMNPATELLAVKALAAVDEPVVSDVVVDVQLVDAAKTTARLSKAARNDLEEALADVQRVAGRLTDLLDADHQIDGEQETKSGNTGTPPNSTEAEAQSKASDQDEDIRTRIRLLKEQTNVYLRP